MFGHDDNKQQTQGDDSSAQVATPDPIVSPSLDSPASANPIFRIPGSAPVVPDSADLNTPEIASTGTPDVPETQDSSGSSAQSVSTPAPADDLLALKQQALQRLSPLVSQLDQTPEEKFRTTMMMIQASDDQTLIKSAFEAAQLITDDKSRAQALLDVINEINYFTQHQQQQPETSY